jgi:hypothetical protein
MAQRLTSKKSWLFRSKGAHLPEATVRYTSESGNHAAIYLYQDDRGIWVYDQWRGQPVHKRLIRFEGGSGSKWGGKSNDGRRFAVIE